MFSTFQRLNSSLLAFTWLMAGGTVASFAQEAAGSASTAIVDRYENSQGQVFLPVPGITVMVSQYETRVGDFEEFVRATSYSWSFRPHFGQTEREPVVGVNLQDAIAYCTWLTDKERASGKISNQQSYRLPTAQEWGAAAGMLSARSKEVNPDQRLEDLQRFVWGKDWPPPAGAGNFQHREMLDYTDNYPFTAPVGQFTPTPEGIYDLAGNVWEWTWDKQISAKAEAQLRGGSWAYFRRETLSSAYVYTAPADLRAPTIGFRCVFDDRQRTATLLAQESQQRAQAQQKRVQDMNQNVDKEAAKKLIEKLDGGGGDSDVVDISKLKPASSSEAYSSSVGLNFLPINGNKKILAGKTEVTVRAMQEWAKAAEKNMPEQPNFNDKPGHPIVNVTKEEADAFCVWLTEKERNLKLIDAKARYRLPTDTEWSQMVGMPPEQGESPSSAHLKNTTHFPWGDNIWPPLSQSDNLDATQIERYRDSSSYTAQVAKHRAGPNGLYDLGGNVSEWVADEWPEASNEYVIRGGSWLIFAKEALLSSARQHKAATFRRYDLGFRCVLDFGQP
jgi:formylglycine-generating enzyme required for sulfatase activity